MTIAKILQKRIEKNESNIFGLMKAIDANQIVVGEIGKTLNKMSSMIETLSERTSNLMLLQIAMQSELTEFRKKINIEGENKNGRRRKKTSTRVST